jgi:hypothetical protein
VDVWQALKRRIVGPRRDESEEERILRLEAEQAKQLARLRALGVYVELAGSRGGGGARHADNANTKPG